ncbi:hypothetical protein L211DRAFT_850454 [Terfezia boudieri ATCC MYA-4762]|uniref:Uncharacterized protein n=1 Tax=Terfezia boudieri ATCC MYA-4762 TaxID=1051890 RepID=A0A3N4LII9_9PEZI|nr:hypothetical protein L211DRAFT_850454 [Terfezia boudieri ATCC MYA-4762]
MPYFIQPVALFSEQTLTTLLLWEFDVDQIVGMPDITPTATLPTGAQVSKPVQNPTVGDCIEVCGANDCDYLRAMPVLNKNGELSVSERVAKDILGDLDGADDLSVQRAAWGLAPQEKCGASQAQEKLRKRQWYPERHRQEYDYAPSTDYYGPEQDPYLYESQYGELPLEFYEPKEYDSYHKKGQPKTQNLQNEYPHIKNTPNNAPQTQQSNRNVKITNDNSGSVNGKEKKNDEKINSALTDPPRRNVGAPSPAAKPNLNKGSTKRYPIRTTKPKSRQSSSSESHSSDPIIAFHSAPTTDDIPTQSHVDAQATEQPNDVAEAVLEAAPQATPQDRSIPHVQKTEHPDGSVEYSFGVVSGEVSVYNEGDAPKKRGRNKSVISNLKSQLGIDDESPPRDRTGWMRKSKRHVVPENKLSAKNAKEKTVSEEGGVELKESVQSQRTPNQKADFLRANGNKPVPKKQAPQLAHNDKQTPKQEQSREEEEAAAQQEITDQQKAEFERLRRQSIKQFYKNQAAQGQDVNRDKEAEKKITEEATRVSSENAQKKREERARRLQGKEPKV